MTLTIRQVGGMYGIWLEAGLPGVVKPGWYVPLRSLAAAVGTTKENITGLISRNPTLCAGSHVLRLARSNEKVTAQRWQQLVVAYDSVRDKHRNRKRKKQRKRPVQNLTMYPLPLAANVVNYYVERNTCSAEQLAVINALVAAPTDYLPNQEEDDDDDDDDDGSAPMLSHSSESRTGPVEQGTMMTEFKSHDVHVKREPMSYLQSTL